MTSDDHDDPVNEACTSFARLRVLPSISPERPADFAPSLFERAIVSASPVILPYFTTREATVLRQTCSYFLEAVTEADWEDDKTQLKEAGLPAWRRCFPHARAVRIWSPSHFLIDIAIYLDGVQSLNVASSGIRDADLARIFYNDKSACRRLRLNLASCRLITDSSLSCVMGRLHTLNISGCRQLTDAIFPSLVGIHTLIISYCDTNNITNAAFASIVGIHTLAMNFCFQHTLSDIAFRFLVGIHTLSISDCPQFGSKALAPLVGITNLNVGRNLWLSDASFLSLVGIHTLNMRGCDQILISDKASESLIGIHSLDIGSCTQITNKFFLSLVGIHTLVMRWCTQEAITDTAFCSLAGIYSLDMGDCSQSTITIAALTHLRGISRLNILGCRFADEKLAIAALEGGIISAISNWRHCGCPECQARLKHSLNL